MKRIYYIPLSLAAGMIGALIYAVHAHWIIISFTTPHTQLQETTPLQQTSASFHFFKNNHWQKEEMSLHLPAGHSEKVAFVINKLCFVLEDEKVITSNIQVESVACTADHTELLLSFTKNPFADSVSIYDKMMLLESFLTTLRENKLWTGSVKFLVFHEPLCDDHINFQVAFPVTGYLQK